MKTEHEAKIRELLQDQDEQGTFLSKCAEFLEYIEVDCAGVSPGRSFFEQSAFGLRHLGSQMPRYKQLFGDAADVYDTLIREAPGPMYPRGSQMFDDLGKIGEFVAALRDASDELLGV